MLGFQPYQVLMEQMYKHHIFISPSVTAKDGDTEGGAPVSIIEASASGMPVVSTTHCDIPEVVQYDNQDWLVPEYDVENLVERMKWLIEHKRELGKMLYKERKHLEKEFDARIQGEKLGMIYLRCYTK